MSNTPTDHNLLNILINGQADLNKKMGDLTDKLGTLIAIESGRLEREKVQDLANKDFKEFMKLNNEPLIRVRRSQGRVDRAIGSIYSKVVLGAIALLIASKLGVQWLG